MNTSSSALSAFRLDGKVAIITGGAGGIGLETAKLFIESGAKVVLLDFNEDRGREALRVLGDRATFLKSNVCDEKDVDTAVAKTIADHGRLDILVNNAGISIRRPTLELELQDWQRVQDVNTTGVFLCARSAAREMVKQGSGAIINTASILGLSGGGLYPNISYHVSKAAVVNMTRALAIEWADLGIRVNAVAPTWVDTDLIAPLTSNEDMLQRIKDYTPLRRVAKPVEIAQAILFLASDAAAMITGHTLPVDGGIRAK